MIIAIIKIIDVNNIIHITDKYYWLIIIQGLGDLLIYIIPSYSLIAKLAKQKEKKNLIKIEVHNIYKPRLTSDIINILEDTNLVIK